MLLGTFAVVAAIIALALPSAAQAQLPNWPPQAFPLEAPAGEDCVSLTSGCPNTLVTGPDGAIWFLEFWGSRVARMTTAGEVTASYPTPTADAQPEKIIRGPEGDLWFSEYFGDRIGRVVFEDGQFEEIVEYPVETAPGGPVGVAAGPDGRIWFVTREAQTVGRLDPTAPDGDIEEFPIPSSEPAPFGPFGIAAGPDGAMWFTQELENQIGRIPVDAESAAEIEEFPIRTPDPGYALHPADIIQGPEGDLWFTEAVGEQIGHVDPATGVVTEYPMPACVAPGVSCGSFWINAGPDGNLWFTAFDSGDPEGNWLGRSTPAGTVEMEQLPSLGGEPYGVAPGPDCAIWFTEFQTNAINRLQTGCLEPEFTVDPASFDFGSRLAGAGPGAAQAFTVGNEGDAPMEIGTVALAGADPGEFSFGLDECSDATLQPTEECTVEVAFAPTGAGAKSASVSFPGDDPGSAALAGTGISGPAFTVAPASFDFGSRQVGSGPGTAQAFTVTNEGDAGMEIGTVALAGADPGDFALSADGCSDQTLAPAASCAVSVAFAPASAGAQAASLEFPGEDPGAVALTGNGTEPTVVPPPPPAPPLPPTPPQVEITVKSPKVAPEKVRAGAKAKISFKASASTRVQLTIGKKTGSGYAKVTSFRRQVKAGHNVVPYKTQRKHKGRSVPLAAGSYRVSVQVVSGGEVSAPLHARFRVVRR